MLSHHEPDIGSSRKKVEDKRATLGDSAQEERADEVPVKTNEGEIAAGTATTDDEAKAAAREERRKAALARKAAREAAGGVAGDADDEAKAAAREERRKAALARKAAREAAGEASEGSATDGAATLARESMSREERRKAALARKAARDAKVAEEEAGGAAAVVKTVKKTSSVLSSPEEVLTTLGNDGKRKWMYPVLSVGRFWGIRRILAYSLITLFFALPLIPINGKPAIFIDIAHGEFTFFGLTLLRTDLIIMMVGVMTFLLGIVYITALFGRVWCGWGCPQTVYMEFVFRPIERLVEGKASTRKKRDQKGTLKQKAWRKVLKYFIYLIISLIMAHGFVAYFVGWHDLSKWLLESPTEHWGFFMMAMVTTGLVFFDFTYFREQMCTIACPYARIQSVLQDRQSMIVSFDPARGEPRGRRNRKQRKEEEEGQKIGLGDCIDCRACVRTCPTGIDIRDGLQMECIGCTQCIDACEAIMISVNKPIGLIRYTSENAIDMELLAQGRKPAFGKEEDVVKPSIVRPRTVLYTLALLLLIGTFITALVMRSPIDVSALRISKGVASPYTLVDAHTVANRVQFVLSNHTAEGLHFVIEPLSPKGMTIRYPKGQAFVKAGSSVKVDTFVLAPKKDFAYGRIDAVFKVTTEEHKDEYQELEKFALLGPD